MATFSTGNEGNGPAVPEIGVKQDRHSLSHHNGNPKLLQDLQDSDAFNIKQFSYFLDRLGEVKDADGPLLDTTMALYGSGMAYGHSHGNASLPIILAGGTKLGFKHGKHVDFNLVKDFKGYDKHPGIYHNPVNAKARLSNLLADDGPEDGREDREVRRQQRHGFGGAGVSHPNRILCCLLALCAGAITFFTFAQEKKARNRSAAQPAKGSAAKPGEFPGRTPGTYLSGELVVIDPINRRGGLRLDGDEKERYHAGPLHYFAMLPYGMAWYNGAPAELRDIPLGTHVHGTFHLPPAGEEATIPPLPKGQERFTLEQNHAITLEDDFSYYQRRGQAWKIVALDAKKGKLDVIPAGKVVKDGINGKYTFDIDSVTRIWEGRKLVDLEAITAGRIVQLNLAWSQGSRDKEFTVSELWLDEEGRKFATELPAPTARPLSATALAAGLDRSGGVFRLRRRGHHPYAVRRHGPVPLRRHESDQRQGLLGRLRRQDVAHLVPSRGPKSGQGAGVERRSRTLQREAAAFSCV